MKNPVTTSIVPSAVSVEAATTMALDKAPEMCHDFEMSDTRQAFVGAKGRIVIPAFIREKYGWEAGTELRVVETEGGVEFVPLDTLLDRLEGCMEGLGTVDEFIAEKRAEAAREDAE